MHEKKSQWDGMSVAEIQRALHRDSTTAGMPENCPEYVCKAVALSREMVSTNAPDRKFGYHAVVWLADRLAQLAAEKSNP